jgi:hypothetical protein
MTLADIIWMLVSLLLTLLVLSYLFGDNPVFRITTYIFVGVAAGYVATIVLYQVMWPRILRPLLIGSFGERIFALIPLILGVLLLARLFPDISPFGTLPMSYLVGLGAAVTIGGSILGTIFGQSKGTFALFNLSTGTVPGNLLASLVMGALVLLGTITTLVYFQFTASQKGQQPVQRAYWIEVLSRIGQVFIVITLGALFAGVYLATIAALVDRVGFIRDVVVRLF